MSRKRRSKRYGLAKIISTSVPSVLGKTFIASDQKRINAEMENKTVEENTFIASDQKRINAEMENKTVEENTFTFKPTTEPILNIETKINGLDKSITQMIETYYNHLYSKCKQLTKDTFIQKYSTHLLNAVLSIINNNTEYHYSKDDVNTNALILIENVRKDNTIENVFKVVFNFLFLQYLNYVVKLYCLSLLEADTNGNLNIDKNKLQGKNNLTNETTLISEILSNKEIFIPILGMQMCNALQNFRFIKTPNKRNVVLIDLIYLKLALEKFDISIYTIQEVVEDTKPLITRFLNYVSQIRLDK